MTIPPIGRATNPTVYVANAASVPTRGSNVGKYRRLKTRAAAVPYRKKSYHSIVVPIRLAIATSLIEPAFVLVISAAVSVGKPSPPAHARNRDPCSLES